MLINFEILKYQTALIEELVLSYNMNEELARRVVKNSTIWKMLKKSPDFVMHYSIEDSAEEIYNEYCGIPLEM